MASDTWAPVGMHLDTCHAALRGDSWRFLPSSSILDSTASHLTLKGLPLPVVFLHSFNSNKCPTPVTTSGKLLCIHNTPFDYLGNPVCLCVSVCCHFFAILYVEIDYSIHIYIFSCRDLAHLGFIFGSKTSCGRIPIFAHNQ